MDNQKKLTGKVMDDTTQKVLLILKLLESNTSQKVIEEFLKDRGLPKTFSKWNTLYDERIKPGIESGKITIDSLYELLEDAEEHGNQHVFLFECDEKHAKKIINPSRIEKIADEKGDKQELESFSLADLPPNPTLTNIKFDVLDNEKYLLLKLVEKRESRRFISEDFSNGVYTKKYKQFIERGINTVRLRESGLLEIRIQSHKDSSNYQSDLSRVKRLISEYIPMEGFKEIYLTTATQYLADNGDVLRDEVRYTNTNYINDMGYSVTHTVKNNTASLNDNEVLTDNAKAFMSKDGYAKSMNFWFKKAAKQSTIKSDVHVLISGMINEYALPAQCTKDDYEFVLSRLLKFNS